LRSLFQTAFAILIPQQREVSIMAGATREIVIEDANEADHTETKEDSFAR
jgi:hypothetical protein